MKKKIWALTLAIILICSVFPLAAAAVTGEILVCGINVSAGGYWNADADSLVGATEADYDVHYDATARILTLNNATINAGGTNKIVINADLATGSDLTINLIGNNTVTAGAADTGDSIAIFCNEDLTITGEGNLRAVSNGVNGTGNNRMSAGIMAEEKLAITASGKIEAVGGNLMVSSIGIITDELEISAPGGTVIATGKGSDSSVGVGILAASEATVNAGTVLTDGKTYGIAVMNGNLEVLGGTVEAKSEAQALTVQDGNIPVVYSDSRAVAIVNYSGSSLELYNSANLGTYKYLRIEPKEQITIGGTEISTGEYWKTDVDNIVPGTAQDYNIRYDRATLTLTLNNASINPGGTHAKGIDADLATDTNLTINLIGNNTVTAGTSADVSRAISSDENLTITGEGNLRAVSEGSTIGSSGINAGKKIAITGSGRIEAVGGDSTTAASHGIIARDIEINAPKGTVSAAAGNSTTSVGIRAVDGLSIKAGTVIADGKVFGIISQMKDLEISGGTVEAKSEGQAVQAGTEHSPKTINIYVHSEKIASTSYDGSAPETYSAASLGTYKYLRIAPEEHIMIGETDVFAGGYWNTNGDALVAGTAQDYDIHYDRATRVLTLNNANINPGGTHTIGINAALATDMNLTIELIGNNTVTAGTATNAPSSAVFCSKDLTITGKGNLRAVSNGVNGEDTTTNRWSSGIRSHGKLTITGSGEIEAVGGNSISGTYGISAVELEVNAPGGIVSGTAGENGSYGSGIILTGGASVKAGTVLADGKDSGFRLSGGNLQISGGIVEAKSEGLVIDVEDGIIDIYQNAKIVASRNYNGSTLEIYNPEYLEGYRYLRISPIPSSAGSPVHQAGGINAGNGAAAEENPNTGAEAPVSAAAAVAVLALAVLISKKK